MAKSKVSKIVTTHTAEELGHALGLSKADITKMERRSELNVILARTTKSRRLSNKAAYKPDLSVGETIRVLRKAVGLTLDALATKAEMSKRSLRSIEMDSRSAEPSVLKKLANAMGVPVAALVK